MDKLALTTKLETWPIAGGFAISRGVKRDAVVVVAEISDGQHVGRGECVPYPRYAEQPQSTRAAIEAARHLLSGSPDSARLNLQTAMPPSAARNALDCALWDLSAKWSGRRVQDLALAGAPPPTPAQCITCFTLSLATPDQMAAKAAAVAHLPLLKLKLGGDDGADAERMRMVRQARPDARLVADANEGWDERDLERMLAVAAAEGFEMIEQPLRADADARLSTLERSVPVCADESAHTADSLEALARRYDAVNIKLDKTGGLTHALDMAAQAKRRGLRIMIGCMVATSLAMAPALLLAPFADWLDLDGPLLLAADRPSGLVFRDGLIEPAPAALWG